MPLGGGEYGARTTWQPPNMDFSPLIRGPLESDSCPGGKGAVLTYFMDGEPEKIKR